MMVVLLEMIGTNQMVFRYPPLRKSNTISNLCNIARFHSKMTKPKVYVTREINKEALDLLRERCTVDVWLGTGPIPRTELMANIKDKQAIFCTLTDKIDEEVLNSCNDLKVIATMSVGYDHLNVDKIKKRNIKIGYTPDILTDATAELTIALLLATSRRFFESNKAAKEGKWSSWSPFWMCGPGLSGSTVGIVGFGRIGREVAKILKAFKPREIIFQNRSEKRKEALEVGARQVPFDELLRASDFVIVNCAYTPETKNMFNDEVFGKMKKTSVFINTSRGAVVDQEALVRALKNGTIWAAGLDVMTPEPLNVDHELFKLSNCVVLPHIGSATNETRKAMALMTVENILAALDDKKMPGELII